MTYFLWCDYHVYSVACICISMWYGLYLVYVVWSISCTCGVAYCFLCVIENLSYQFCCYLTQVHILRLLRILGKNDKDCSEQMNDILAQVRVCVCVLVRVNICHHCCY